MLILVLGDGDDAGDVDAGDGGDDGGGEDMVAYSHHDKIPLWWEYVRILSKKQICAGVTKARLIVTIKILTTLNIVRGMMMMMLTMLLMMVFKLFT